MPSTDNTDGQSTEALLEALAAARRERDAAVERVEAVGEAQLERLESFHEQFTTLLGRYEERASGSGDFQAFVEFQEQLELFTNELPADLPERETFEEIDDRLQKRRLTESDFEWAGSRLEPVEDLISRLEERTEANRLVAATKGDIRDAIQETRNRIDRLETIRSLGAADLDAPVEDLREPLERYNESVRQAVTEFRRSAPARDVLGVMQRAQRFPLVPVPEPPEDLQEYLDSAPVGTESIPTLLEYADYSRSKLAHYVESPATFARIVGGSRTYLTGIDATPLTVEWPPPAAETLRWRGRELIAVLDRFAPDETIAAFRSAFEMARTDPDRYASLRLTARAKTQLSDAERNRVADGRIEADLAAARERLETLRDALED
ncbi:DUF7118 family protein [Halodesulfurarchaeum sp.]|uniref:DUF7118 family protein n=1 Tax=Halodesulfurarchaeum sp. TaxID=1980530 RepID=UPI001BBDF2D9|nr:hypothetical protein [Halodesulfurarchaeum sp.]